jgi:hypothetical protein
VGWTQIRRQKKRLGSSYTVQYYSIPPLRGNVRDGNCSKECLRGGGGVEKGEGGRVK